MDFKAIWQETVDELKLQMTEATFATWVMDSQAVAVEDGVLVVEVKNGYAVDWLENRLKTTVKRTLARLTDGQLDVRFVARNGKEEEREERREEKGEGEEKEAQAWARSFVLPEYDVHEAGWFPVSEYECRFWAPLLGRVGWRVWEIVRKMDRRKRKTEWTPTQRWTAPSLAEQVPCGRQALIGVSRRCEADVDGAEFDTDGQAWYHYPGAFERLVDEGIATVEKRGVNRHTTYWISVRIQLGLLRPRQVAQLPARLQVQHDRWLEARGFNPRDWDV